MSKLLDELKTAKIIPLPEGEEEARKELTKETKRTLVESFLLLTKLYEKEGEIAHKEIRRLEGICESSRMIAQDMIQFAYPQRMGWGQNKSIHRIYGDHLEKIRDKLRTAESHHNETSDQRT